MDYKERGDGGIIFQTFLQPLENKVCFKRLTVPKDIYTYCSTVGRGAGGRRLIDNPPPPILHFYPTLPNFETPKGVNFHCKYIFSHTYEYVLPPRMFNFRHQCKFGDWSTILSKHSGTEVQRCTLYEKKIPLHNPFKEYNSLFIFSSSRGPTCSTCVTWQVT